MGGGSPLWPRPHRDEEDGASMADDSSLLLMPSHSRTKSNARRRPRKERRSTGIGQCEVRGWRVRCVGVKVWRVRCEGGGWRVCSTVLYVRL